MSAESLQSSAIAACLRISRLLTRRRPILLSKMLMCLSLKSERKLVFIFSIQVCLTLNLTSHWIEFDLSSEFAGLPATIDPSHQWNGVYWCLGGKTLGLPQQKPATCNKKAQAAYNAAWCVRRIVLVNLTRPCRIDITLQKITFLWKKTIVKEPMFYYQKCIKTHVRQSIVLKIFRG